MRQDCTLLILLAASLSAATVPAQEKESLAPELDKLKVVYQDQLQKAEEKQAADTQRAAAAHLQALKDLEADFQKAGELRALLAVRTERTRFEENSAPGAVSVAQTPTRLKGIQEQFIEACRAAILSQARTIKDTTEKYARRLMALQRELTQKGRINAALKVLEEAEGLNKTAAMRWANTQVSAGGSLTASPAAVPSTDTPGAPPPDAGMAPAQPTDSGDIIRGEMVAWNPRTRQIHCKYDFNDESQARDWAGGTIDDLRGRLDCSRNVAWLALEFAAVTRIEFDGYFFDGDGRITVTLGQGLTAEFGGGPDQDKHRVYQQNAHYPIAEIDGTVKAFIRYTGVVSIAGNRVEVSVNGKPVARTNLQRPITYPVKVGFGSTQSRTMYDNVSITGTLSE